MNWLAWAAASFLFMGLANFGMKAASDKGLNSAQVLFWVVMGELPLAGAYFWFKGRGAQPGAGVAWGLAAGVATGLALIALNEGFARGAKAAIAVAMMNANFVLVALLAFLVFKEHLQAAKLTGLGLTLVGLWLMAR
jgi:drug/metabolite transporter (DMT)-like permease